ncbi:MAG: flagellar motor switch protein FliN [Candidatus Hydrogenedentes bacterium]|nr:flagellar motor switch protein FliN [Candidatus Hydrogenedentota bacterium]
MNEALSRIIAEGFLEGAFDVFDAMLSLPFSHSITELAPLDEVSLRAHIAQTPVVLRARVKSGGAVALFLTVKDASRFAALVLGNQPIEKTTLDADDIGTLREIAAPCLGGGVTNLMEQFGRNVEQPEQVEVESVEAGAAAQLVAFFDGNPVGAPFGFSAEAIDSRGLFAFSAQLERLVPASQGGAPIEETATAEISNEEVRDILSGIENDEGAPETPAAEVSRRRGIPPNIDMVLDIRMVATARLGRIEMPIGEILSLGPGSIIQVGRLVDEPVELLVNEKLIARGDVVVVDEKFGLRITEIVSTKERIESLH